MADASSRAWDYVGGHGSEVGTVMRPRQRLRVAPSTEELLGRRGQRLGPGRGATSGPSGHPLLVLQSTAGNQAVSGLVQRSACGGGGGCGCESCGDDKGDGPPAVQRAEPDQGDFVPPPNQPGCHPFTRKQDADIAWAR